MSFRSEKIYYPLRFSSRQGLFDVLLHVFTDRPIDTAASQPYLERIRAQGGLRNFEVAEGELRGSLADVRAKVQATPTLAAPSAPEGEEPAVQGTAPIAGAAILGAFVGVLLGAVVAKVRDTRPGALTLGFACVFAVVGGGVAIYQMPRTTPPVVAPAPGAPAAALRRGWYLNQI